MAKDTPLRSHQWNTALTVSADDGFWKLSPCAQMLSVTNAMCSASSMKGETRNRAHLFKSSIDYKERKEKEDSVSFQAPMATDLHSLAYIPSPCFFRKDLQIYPIHFCRPLQPSVRPWGFKPLYGSWSGSQEFQSLWISVPCRSF